MYRRLILIAVLLIFIAACQDQKKNAQKSLESSETKYQFDLPDSLSTRRISFVMDLKEAVAESAWPGFGEKRTEGTLIYFDGDRSEVFFPNSPVIKTLFDSNKHSEDYWLTGRTDSIPWHMEVMISFDEADSSQFFYENPVEQYSSVEEIGKFIPSVESTEMWATMVLHEMFHHYQYNNENYREYGRSEIGILPFNINDLVSLSYEDEEFLAMIQKENDYLMEAIAEDDKEIRDSLITNYLKDRNHRIQKYSTAHPDLEKVENYYVIQEGSARYIEYKSMHILSDYANRSDSPVISNDPMFKSYSEFKEIDLKDPAFNYLIYAAPTDYHYSIGFNIMRLLDELKIEYKDDILDNPEKGLHEYLEDYIIALPNNKKPE